MRWERERVRGRGGEGEGDAVKGRCCFCCVVREAPQTCQEAALTIQAGAGDGAFRRLQKTEQARVTGAVAFRTQEESLG